MNTIKYHCHSILTVSHFFFLFISLFMFCIYNTQTHARCVCVCVCGLFSNIYNCTYTGWIKRSSRRAISMVHCPPSTVRSIRAHAIVCMCSIFRIHTLYLKRERERSKWHGLWLYFVTVAAAWLPASVVVAAIDQQSKYNENITTAWAR